MATCAYFVHHGRQPTPRPGMGIARALVEIERGMGTRYDAVVAPACLRIFCKNGYGAPDW